MKTKIAIFTTTRAEFGLLSAFLKELKHSKNIEPLLFVGGSHLTYEAGYTIDEIKGMSIDITDTFDYLLNEDTETVIAKSLGYATIEIANIFRKYSFDFVCVLGDRYELLAIANNAIISKKPIIHIHGGEITEGAIDEQIRHMITKASHLHFAACQDYAQNIICMGEEAWRVHNVGALAVDNFLQIEKIDRNNLFHQLNLENKETVLLTYHPVTLENKISPSQQTENIFEAFDKFEFQVVITAPNCDKGNKEIIDLIQKKLTTRKNYHFFTSLGVKNYINLVQNCLFVAGNSSSGIIEVPFFKIPTLNIGSRQKGRIMHESIINSDYSAESIAEGIRKAIDPSFRDNIRKMNYKFGDGNASKKMVSIIEQTNIDEKLIRKKLICHNE